MVCKITPVLAKSTILSCFLGLSSLRSPRQAISTDSLLFPIAPVFRCAGILLRQHFIALVFDCAGVLLRLDKDASCYGMPV